LSGLVKIVRWENTLWQLMLVQFAKRVTQGSTRQQKKIVALIVQEESIKKKPQYFMNATHAKLDTAST